MKIEELSVGDWVRCEQFAKKHKIEETHPCKVVKLEDFVLDSCVWIRAVTTYQDGKFLKYKSHIDHESIPVKHLTPIPLTPEILEKNGFTLCNGCTSRWELEYGAYWFRVTAPDDYADVTIYKKVAHGYKRVVDEWEITAVHQLQHALRLAGIEKEIEV